ncbi:MAG: hypothetical protein U5L09_11205 [Bacteroidales bacterium]|nr:hypothetical protein [Bacteroidales bacterium]
MVLRLNSTYESPVLIELLEVSGQLGWNINERVDEQVKGKGVHTIRVFNSKELDSNMAKAISVSGYLRYSSAESGAKKTLAHSTAKTSSSQSGNSSCSISS